MATLTSGKTVGPRIEAGDHLLDVAESLKERTKPVKGRLTAFAAAHQAYKKADEVVKACDAKLRAGQGAVGERDVTQDDGVEELASALVGEGFPRANPFKAFGVAAPNTVKNLGYEAEAKVVLALVKKVRAHKSAGPKSKAAATACEKAAKAVLAALLPIPNLLKARTKAISRRDALEQPWETAFAALKRGARSAEDDGAIGLFDALFGVPKPGSGSRPKKGGSKGKKGDEKATKGDGTKGKKEDAAKGRGVASKGKGAPPGDEEDAVETDEGDADGTPG